MNRFKCPVCGGNQYTSCGTAEGCIYCGHKELKKMETLEPKEGVSVLQNLTRQQRKIVKLLAEGYDNYQIADALKIAPQTVKHHVSASIKKLGVSSRTEIVVMYYKEKIKYIEGGKNEGNRAVKSS